MRQSRMCATGVKVAGSFGGALTFAESYDPRCSSASMSSPTGDFSLFFASFFLSLLLFPDLPTNRPRVLLASDAMIAAASSEGMLAGIRHTEEALEASQ